MINRLDLTDCTMIGNFNPISMNMELHLVDTNSTEVITPKTFFAGKTFSKAKAKAESMGYTLPSEVL